MTGGLIRRNPERRRPLFRELVGRAPLFANLRFTRMGRSCATAFSPPRSNSVDLLTPDAVLPKGTCAESMLHLVPCFHVY
jgi:hypothetical protein